MKSRLLLTMVATLVLLSADAQKKRARTTAYAITGAEKGDHRWTEVNLIDVKTGEVINPVYQSKRDVRKLNARTGKPIAVNQNVLPTMESSRVHVAQSTPDAGKKAPGRTRVDNRETTIITRSVGGNAPRVVTESNRVMVRKSMVKKEEPFATNSAALAFDRKHDRLYYTPMGINELRYIDLKEKSPAVYYFEGEAFGKVAHPGDVENQITRMVVAADGNGYALSNNANQLIRFTTRNKPVITDLGAISDDASNGKFSIRNSHAYGGDMVAEKDGNLVLVTANRRVYRISVKDKNAVYLGSIKGLPDGYTTNGAVVAADNRIVVTSSNATTGYYNFDVRTMRAEKVSADGAVFNASDLANANLLSVKEKKQDKPAEETLDESLAQENKLQSAVERSFRGDATTDARFTVYPNPVTGTSTRLSMSNFVDGIYEIQLMDLSGKLVRKQVIRVSNKSQLFDFTVPRSIAKGNYVVRVQNASGGFVSSEKLVVR